MEQQPTPHSQLPKFLEGINVVTDPVDIIRNREMITTILDKGLLHNPRFINQVLFVVSNYFSLDTNHPVDLGMLWGMSLGSIEDNNSQFNSGKVSSEDTDRIPEVYEIFYKFAATDPFIRDEIIDTIQFEFANTTPDQVVLMNGLKNLLGDNSDLLVTKDIPQHTKDFYRCEIGIGTAYDALKRDINVGLESEEKLNLSNSEGDLESDDPEFMRLRDEVLATLPIDSPTRMRDAETEAFRRFMLNINDQASDDESDIDSGNQRLKILLDPYRNNMEYWRIVRDLLDSAEFMDEVHRSEDGDMLLCRRAREIYEEQKRQKQPDGGDSQSPSEVVPHIGGNTVLTADEAAAMRDEDAQILEPSVAPAPASGETLSPEEQRYQERVERVGQIQQEMQAIWEGLSAANRESLTYAGELNSGLEALRRIIQEIEEFRSSPDLDLRSFTADQMNLLFGIRRQSTDYSEDLEAFNNWRRFLLDGFNVNLALLGEREIPSNPIEVRAKIGDTLGELEHTVSSAYNNRRDLRGDIESRIRSGLPDLPNLPRDLTAEELIHLASLHNQRIHELSLLAARSGSRISGTEESTEAQNRQHIENINRLLDEIVALSTDQEAPSATTEASEKRPLPSVLLREKIEDYNSVIVSEADKVAGFIATYKGPMLSEVTLQEIKLHENYFYRVLSLLEQLGFVGPEITEGEPFVGMRRIIR